YKASNGRLELIGGGDVLLVFGRK
ncbi:MAG: hypothetical protein JWQ96_2364, partial [Segetibacter sp.]|nr:hypothetical protein [Segetibacter sp.]